MKKYTRTAINGDAGEYFLAYKITSMFGFATRLLDVDLGVDAEIEVIDVNVSTTHIIKAQIKSSDNISGNKHTVSVKQENVEYWKEINLPVVVFLVDLKTEKIYWQHIKSEANYTTSGVSNKVEFDLQSMELTVADRSSFEELAIPQEKQVLESLRTEINLLLDALPEPIPPYASHCWDTGLAGMYETLRKAEALLSQLLQLLAFHPDLSRNGFLTKVQNVRRRLTMTQNYLDKCAREADGME